MLNARGLAGKRERSGSGLTPGWTTVVVFVGILVVPAMAQARQNSLVTKNIVVDMGANGPENFRFVPAEAGRFAPRVSVEKFGGRDVLTATGVRANFYNGDGVKLEGVRIAGLYLGTSIPWYTDFTPQVALENLWVNATVAVIGVDQLRQACKDAGSREVAVKQHVDLVGYGRVKDRSGVFDDRSGHSLGEDFFEIKVNCKDDVPAKVWKRKKIHCPPGRIIAGTQVPVSEITREPDAAVWSRIGSGQCVPRN